MSDRRTWLGLSLALMLVAVYAGYYLVHKPLSPAQAAALAGTSLSVAVAALLTGLGGGLGRRVLRKVLGEDAAIESGIRTVLAVALGWGLLALGVFVLGLLQLLFAGVLWVAFGLLLAWLWRDVLAWTREVLAAVRGLAPAGGLERICLGYVGFVLGLGAVLAAAPPLKWDALVYHLTLPKLYAQTHGLYLPTADFSLFTGMPQLAEMLYTAAMLLRLEPAAGGIAAQLLGWVAGAILALGLAAAARAHGLPGWLAPAILFSSFSVASALAWAYADLLLMLLALAMLLALDVWHRQRTLPWLVLAGAYGGLAFGCKYTGAIVPLGGVALVAYTLWRCPEPGPAVRARLLAAGAFITAAAVVAVPWLLKNWALTGSPLYPLLFPAADMDAARLWFYNRPDLVERSLPRAALIFWRAAFLGVQGGNDFDVTVGPLLILLPAALALSCRQLPAPQRQPLGQWVLFAVIGYAGWVLLVLQSTLAEQVRLFFAVLPALALLGAGAWAGLRRLDTPALRISLVMSAGLVLALGLSALELANHFVSQQPLAYLAGHQLRPEFEFNRLGWYPVALARLNALPAGARIQFLWEARSLACAAHIHCVPDVVIDRWWHLRHSGATADDSLRQWQAAGVTHVLVYETGQAFARADAKSPFAPGDWTDLDALRGQLTLVETIGGAYSLYALPAP
jgi:hypothetical protein